jgi:hypothetical protein
MAAFALLAAYLAFVAWHSLHPLSVLWVSPANLEPFHTIRSDIDRGLEPAVRTIGSGMLRLAPLGVLMPLLGMRLGGSRFCSLVRTVFTGAMIALLIEWSQSLVPSRVADVDSIILNTAGIALTHLLAYGRLRSLALRDQADQDNQGSRSRATAHSPAATETPEAPRGEHGGTGSGSGSGTGTEAARHRAAPHGVRGAALSR